MARWTLDAARIAKSNTKPRKNHRKLDAAHAAAESATCGLGPVQADNANEPSADAAAWFIDHQLESGSITDLTTIPRERAADWGRSDIFNQAKQFTNTP